MIYRCSGTHPLSGGARPCMCWLDDHPVVLDLARIGPASAGQAGAIYWIRTSMALIAGLFLAPVPLAKTMFSSPSLTVVV